jgi:acyl carrier protein
MDNIRATLLKCFESVFPALSPAQIEAANQASVAEWDSVAAITLVNVIEEEFGITMDFDKLADLDSFDKVLEYLRKEVRQP